MSQDLQDSVKSARKSLKTLQRSSSDRENLAGRPSKTLKHQLSRDSPGDVEVKRKTLTSKKAQVDSLDSEISVEDLTNAGVASVAVEVKRKTLSTKKIQADLDSEITVEDLTNPDGASETYWKILAEKRQVALQETLVENEKLLKIINDLKTENALYKQMLDEANSFVEVIKEELANASKDDTGIDVNDVSTADETFDSPEDDDDAERGSLTTKK